MSTPLFSAAWQSPSNIALVKYWGKYGHQLPKNASVSFTLEACNTRSRLELVSGTGIDLEVTLNGVKTPSFEPKIRKFLSAVRQDFPWISEFEFRLETSNSFPHSSGIASSASGMSALALALCDLHEKISGERFNDFFRSASHYARIGSGSASRSVYGGLVVWGAHESIEGSNQEYALPYPYEVHPVFQTMCDTILLVHQGSKSVSSSAGHELMEGHAFAEARYAEARRNMARLIPILKSGELVDFLTLVESEALMLHGLMMSSIPYFILMKPQTLQIIEKIWEYRKQNRVPVFFTLDAGANVHLLYPAEIKTATEAWIQSELSGLCENNAYICDAVGAGPKRLSE